MYVGALRAEEVLGNMNEYQPIAEKALKHQFYRRYGKRICDIFFSLLMIILLSPILLVLAVLVRIKHGSPVIFSPTRPGKNEKVFRIYKFRSMSNARDSRGVLLPDKDRVTKFGKILRATSLDELPELFNILFGDMSFVGPRPLAKNTLPFYTDEYRQRFSVLPGLTGLAQIRGRNGLEWHKRFRYDLEYIQNMSLLYDLKIVFETALKVVKKADVTVPGTTELLSVCATRQIDIQGKIQPIGPDGKRREIGGDFWRSDWETGETGGEMPAWLPRVQDSTFTFAGRSAIELALVDILSERPIRSACLPSLCSFGMVQSFIERNIPYDFYDVVWNGGRLEYRIDGSKHYDVVVIAPYLGVNRTETEKRIGELRQCGTVVIKEITHTLLDGDHGGVPADYYTASLRKWFPIASGGWLGKTSGTLAVKPDKNGDNKVQNLCAAMQQKAQYMAGQTDNKIDYIKGFSNFDQWLVLLDCKTKMDTQSQTALARVAVEPIIRQRRANAQTLYNALSGIPEIRFMNRISDWETGCPLYVPVLVADGKRNALADYLSDHGIYCRVTWPERMGAKNGIRNQELSLICDQRYTENDMDYLADTVADFFRK